MIVEVVFVFEVHAAKLAGKRQMISQVKFESLLSVELLAANNAQCRSHVDLMASSQMLFQCNLSFEALVTIIDGTLEGIEAFRFSSGFRCSACHQRLEHSGAFLEVLLQLKLSDERRFAGFASDKVAGVLPLVNC